MHEVQRAKTFQLCLVVHAIARAWLSVQGSPLLLELLPSKVLDHSAIVIQNAQKKPRQELGKVEAQLAHQLRISTRCVGRTRA